MRSRDARTSVAAHIPYSRHVSDEIVRTDDGMLMSFLHLSGFRFETADISEVNSRLLGRNDLLRALGSSRYALYTHIVRREVKPSIPSTFDNDFAANSTNATPPVCVSGGCS